MASKNHKHEEDKIADLKESVDDLRRTIDRFPKRYVWIFDPAHQMLFSFIRGILYSLGFVVAVVIITPIIIYLLRSIEWIPLIGEVIAEIVKRVELISPLK